MRTNQEKITNTTKTMKNDQHGNLKNGQLISEQRKSKHCSLAYLLTANLPKNNAIISKLSASAFC